MQTTYDLGLGLVKRLQALATPFVDTPVSVIERCVEFYEKQQHSQENSGTTMSTANAAELYPLVDPDTPPNLVHTRVSGSFGENSFSKWNELVRLAHVQAFKKAGSFEALAKVSHAQLRKGSETDGGFHFVREIGFSVQGVDSNHAWEYSLHLARYLKVPIQAVVCWRFKEGAPFPGESRELRWNPNPT